MFRTLQPSTLPPSPYTESGGCPIYLYAIICQVQLVKPQSPPPLPPPLPAGKKISYTHAQRYPRTVLPSIPRGFSSRKESSAGRAQDCCCLPCGHPPSSPSGPDTCAFTVQPEFLVGRSGELHFGLHEIMDEEMERKTNFVAISDERKSCL